MSKSIKLTTAAFLFTREKSASEIAELIGDVSKRTIERWATREEWHAILDELGYTGDRSFRRNPKRDTIRDNKGQVEYVHDVYVQLIREGVNPRNAARRTSERTGLSLSRVRLWEQRFQWRERDQSN